MNDPISRQAAIDEVQRHRENVLGGYEYDEGVASVYAAAHNHIIEVIKCIPSAQQWIPCSERLPDKEGEYLVTFNDKWCGPKVRTLWYGTPFDIIIDKDKWVFYCDQDYGFETFAPGKPVVAWMRMPDPYNDGHE